jgi:nitrogen fixation NifU-like protein
MYSERLLDHFRNPRNAGELPPPAESVEALNPACGDVLKLYVRWEGDTVADVRYQVRGCTASIAAGSALTEWMRGRTRPEVAALEPASIEEALGGLPPPSRHAAVLCADAAHALAGAA